MRRLVSSLPGAFHPLRQPILPVQKAWQQFGAYVNLISSHRFFSFGLFIFSLTFIDRIEAVVTAKLLQQFKESILWSHAMRHCFIHLLLWVGLLNAPWATAVPRIVNGEMAQAGAQPWMAALLEKGSVPLRAAHFCGGTLIQPRIVLTSAHCVIDYRPAEIEVLLDSDSLRPPYRGERIAVSALVTHPQYDHWTLNNDIALILLARPSTQTPLAIDAGTATLLTSLDPGKRAVALGWGETYPSDQTIPPVPEDLDCIVTTIGQNTPLAGQFDCLIYPNRGSSELLRVELPLVDPATCRTVYKDWLADTMLCAGYAEGGKDTCTGDSGGPLLVDIGERMVQIGITSWGTGCAQPESYGIYTAVWPYRDWISRRAGQLTFQAACPRAPELSVSQEAIAASGQTRVILSWNAVDNAEAYTLFYVQPPHFDAIHHLDMGMARQFSADLDPGQAYLVALQARNARCASPFSNVEWVEP